MKFERELSEKANLKSNDLIFYCPRKAPGFQKVRQSVALGPSSKAVHGGQEPYLRLRNSHLNLWTAYVFVPPDMEPDRVSCVARNAEEMLNLTNEANLGPKQLALY
jgi:hypothetical protein